MRQICSLSDSSRQSTFREDNFNSARNYYPTATKKSIKEALLLSASSTEREGTHFNIQSYTYLEHEPIQPYIKTESTEDRYGDRGVVWTPPYMV